MIRTLGSWSAMPKALAKGLESVGARIFPSVCVLFVPMETEATVRGAAGKLVGLRGGKAAGRTTLDRLPWTGSCREGGPTANGAADFRAAEQWEKHLQLGVSRILFARGRGAAAAAACSTPRRAGPSAGMVHGGGGGVAENKPNSCPRCCGQFQSGAAMCQGAADCCG